MKLNLPIVFFLISVSSAHFTLDFPPARSSDDDSQSTFPCGGHNSIASERTPFPLSGGPIQMTMGHDRSAVQVLIALGNDATEAFNTVLVPTTQEEGIGQFCLSNVQIPESLGVKEGDNATIQVVTNGDPTGGLYNPTSEALTPYSTVIQCADITFSSTNTTLSECTNGKGVQQTQYTGRFSNANGTDSAASTTSSASGTGTPSATGSASTASPSSAAGKRELGEAAVLAVCMLEAWALW